MSPGAGTGWILGSEANLYSSTPLALSSPLYYGSKCSPREFKEASLDNTLLRKKYGVCQVHHKSPADLAPAGLSTHVTKTKYLRGMEGVGGGGGGCSVFVILNQVL